MSTVWLALDTRLGRRVAIKFLSDDLADAEARRRFQREAQMASSLNHPHIVTVYDIGEFEGRQYLVTEYVDGGTLKDWVKEKRRTPKEVAELLTGVADGLAAAHQAGILHRDIKPMNILVARNGYAKLADFGLAKLAENGTIDLAASLPEGPTRPGLILGTIAYMSPEQASGQPLDSRSDIFSFGVVLYEMLSGKRPFGGRTDLEVLKTIIHGELPPLSEEVPEAYRNVVEKALEKSPAERYQSMREMVVDLRRGQRSQPLPAPGVEEAIAHVEGGVARPGQLAAGVSPAPPPKSSRRVLYYGPALLGAVLVAAGVLAVWMGTFRKPSAPRVVRFRQLTYDGHPKVGPIASDGSRVYFTELQPAVGRLILQVAVKGGEAIPVPVLLGQTSVHDLSKDGTEFLISSGKREEGDPLWIQPVLGGSPRRVGTVLGYDAGFSADGTDILYGTEHDVYSVGLDGSSSRKLFTVDGTPAAFRFSPDAKVLRFTEFAYLTDGMKIMEASPDGTTLRQFVDGCCGNWTPDGRFYVFQNRVEGRLDLWAIPEKRPFWPRKQEPKPTQLTSGPLEFQYPLPSKDGKEVFAIGSAQRAEVVRYDSRSGEFIPFLAGISARGVAFSPDGQLVAYTSYPDGTLWRSKVDGSERLQLTFPPLETSLPRWSPDGKQIAFNANLPGEPPNIYLVPSGGGTPQRILPSEESQMDANWSPDGNSLVFATLGVANMPIYIIDLKTRQVSALSGSNGLFSPHWSPDGRYVTAITSDSAMRLMLFDFHTQKWTEAFGSTVAYETWSHDGKYIYFKTFPPQGNCPIVRFRMDDRKIEEVADPKKIWRVSGGASEGCGWFGLAPDDSPVVAREIGAQEIYALEVDWP